MAEGTPEFIYANVLEALTGGLYPNKLDVVREYIQNSYDAIRERIRICEDLHEETELKENLRIDVHIDAGSMFIFDNALGMDYETLNEYRKIGFSRKPYGEYAGWRGIGKAAGLAVSEKLLVTTSTGNGKTHLLTFDARKMIDEIKDLRSKGENIPFNKLIEKYSIIKSSDGGDAPFTNIELHMIKNDAKELLDEEEVIAHLSLLSPVPFSPAFAFKEEIETELHDILDDYCPVNLYVNSKQIYKPHIHEWGTEGKKTTLLRPSTVTIYDEDKKDILAFCWYCMNSESSQITEPRSVSENKSVTLGGLLFRVDDIKIGERSLTRSAIWKVSSHLAYYATGEIHVIDNAVEPSSDRNGFSDNFARYHLFNECKVISSEINRKARRTSKETRAEKKITAAGNTLEVIKSRVAEKYIPIETATSYIHQLQELRVEVNKRSRETSRSDLKDKAGTILKESSELLEIITSALSTPQAEEQIYVYTPDLFNLGEESKVVYDTIVSVLKEFYSYSPAVFEDILRKIRVAFEEASE